MLQCLCSNWAKNVDIRTGLDTPPPLVRNNLLFHDPLSPLERGPTLWKPPMQRQAKTSMIVKTADKPRWTHI